MATDSSSPTSPNDGRKWQTVFRVRLNPPAEAARTRDLAPTKRRTAGFRPRRTHQKSRAGCLVCKRRRVKVFRRDCMLSPENPEAKENAMFQCDETRPYCHNCTSYGASCSYLAAAAAAAPPISSDDVGGIVEPLGDPSMTMFTMSLDNIATKIEETLCMNSGPGYRLPKLPGSEQSLAVLALRHFVTSTVETISTPAVRSVMRTDVIRVAFSSPHLMHTILGVALLHINRMLPPCNSREYAEAHHWQKALEAYRKALYQKVTPTNVDALLTTCLLMLVNCMCPPNYSPSDAWVLSNDPSAMNWVCLQNGLPYLIEASSPILHLSIWGSVFSSTDQAHGKYSNECSQGREGMNTRLADFCQIDDSTTEETSPYFKPLQVVSLMLEMEKSATTSSFFSSFLGHMDHRFISLLRVKDVKALLILAHWLGIMCLISHWEQWVEGRLRAECIAICIYLTPMAGAELLELLRFPSIASGFVESVELP